MGEIVEPEDDPRCRRVRIPGSTRPTNVAGTAASQAENIFHAVETGGLIDHQRAARRADRKSRDSRAMGQRGVTGAREDDGVLAHDVTGANRLGRNLRSPPRASFRSGALAVPLGASFFVR